MPNIFMSNNRQILAFELYFDTQITRLTSTSSGSPVRIRY